MTLLGHRKYTAKRLAKTFLKHDEKSLKKLASIRNQEDYITANGKYIEELELIVQADAERPLLLDAGWDAETLREEVKEMTS
jgi:monovalent cation:H+ antiporter-2, CPA2 family